MVRLLICVNILRLSHFRTCLWHFSLRRTWPTWAFHYSAHVYMFSDVLAPRPHSMSFYIKNKHVKLYGFFDELSWWSSSPRPQSTSNLQKIMDWIIFALALGADGPCAQVNSFRWHWLGSGGTHEKNTVPHCEVLVHSVPYFSITFITLFKSFSKSFWKFKNLKMKMYFHFLFKFCWFRKCSKMVLKNVCSTCFC